MRPRRRVWRVVGVLVAIVLLSTSCRIDTDSVLVAGSASPTTANDAAASGEIDDGGAVEADTGIVGGGLRAIGPSPGGSHWHAAYVVRICDEVLAPFDGQDDPLGIHSHQDGIIHIHPFVESAGYEQATLKVFLDAVGASMGTAELTLPGGGTWRDGDLCNGVPGQVFVDRWADPDPTGAVERIFEDPQNIAFEADGELLHIGFAAADSPPVVPPTLDLLPQVSNLVLDPVDPWVVLPDGAQASSVQMWPVLDVTAEPCTGDAVVESVAADLAPSCFSPGEPVFGASDAVVSASPVLFNRQPAVDLQISPAFRQFLVDWFEDAANPRQRGLAIAVEVEGQVVTAPLLARLPASESRMVIAGGMSTETARSLAELLNP